MTQNEYVMPPPSAEKIAKVMALVSEMKIAMIEADKAEVELKEKKTLVEQFQREKIPELMREMGLTELPLINGEKLVIDDKVNASIPKDRFEEAVKWLESHGEGGMVKRVVTVAFNRDQEKEAKALIEQLKPKFAGVKVDSWIEPPTLKAFATKRVKEPAPKEDEEEFPKELFGIFRFDEAKVKEKKAKKAVFEGE